MFVKGFPAGPWGTNCFVVADKPGADALIIDPGMDSVAGIAQIVNDNALRPAAVLLTHGHLDHTFSVFPVCDSHDIPAFIHADDRGMLADPISGFSRQMAQAVNSMLGKSWRWREPKHVEEMGDQQLLEVLGLPITVHHTPGHTPGSSVFALPADDTTPELLFSGDLLFAGSIGRTDLPGGSHSQMLTSLATVLPRFSDATLVLPGHGDITDMATERATNPYLTNTDTKPGRRL